MKHEFNIAATRYTSNTSVEVNKEEKKYGIVIIINNLIFNFKKNYISCF